MLIKKTIEVFHNHNPHKSKIRTVVVIIINNAMWSKWMKYGEKSFSEMLTNRFWIDFAKYNKVWKRLLQVEWGLSSSINFKFYFQFKFKRQVSMGYCFECNMVNKWAYGVILWSLKIFDSIWMENIFRIKNRCHHRLIGSKSMYKNSWTYTLREFLTINIFQ